MKSSIARWVGRVPDVSAVISRFPVPVAIMAVFTGILIVLGEFYNREELGRAMFGMVLAAYVGVMVTIAREAKGKSNLWWLQALIAIIFFGVFWVSEPLRLNLPMAGAAVLLALGNAIVWRRARNDVHLWDFTHKIWTGAAFSALGCILYTLGILAILAALQSLFGLRLNKLAEHFLYPIGLAFLAPLYWLSTIPAVDEPYEDLYENPGFVSKAVAFLGTWILSPLSLIYALILLAYALKIALAGELPKGEIAQLTTPFLLIGTLTWLILEPPFIQTKVLAKLFRKLWFPVSLPAAALLAIAVFVRIREYGYTEERFALTLCVVWAIGTALWFTFGPKSKRDIRLIPGFGSALLVMGAVVAGWLSVGNQSARLEGYLAEINQAEEMNFKTAQKAKGAMSYLWRKEKKDGVRQAVMDAGFDVKDDADLDSLYDALKIKGISMPSKYGTRHSDTVRYEREKNSPIKIAGYDALHGPYYMNLGRGGERTLNEIGNYKIAADDGELAVFEGETELARFDLTGWAKSQMTEGGTLVVDDPQIVILDRGGRKIGIDVSNLTLWTPASENRNMDGNLEFYLLTKGL